MYSVPDFEVLYRTTRLVHRKVQMETSRGSVGRHRGVWSARVQFVHPVTGKRMDIRRTAPTKAEACDLRDEILRMIRSTGPEQFAEKERKTFAELADHYEHTYAIPAEYVDKRRVAGMRAWKTARGFVKVLRAEFGVRQLRSITHGEIVALKRRILKTPAADGHQRSIAYVNRLLSTLRRMLNIAQREAWIERNPFNAGDPLISVADEKKRTRILSREEEIRLLAACEHPRRQHLRPIIICALDTGMRFGEILKLRWCDVNFRTGLITIEAMHTKTLTERQVALTARLRSELLALQDEHSAESSVTIFGVTITVKHSFGSVREEAELLDFRFHDLRHTAATRLTAGGMPLAEVGRILGHSDPKTTYRYVNADSQTLMRGRLILEAFHRQDVISKDSRRGTRIRLLRSLSSRRLKVVSISGWGSRGGRKPAKLGREPED